MGRHVVTRGMGIGIHWWDAKGDMGSSRSPTRFRQVVARIHRDRCRANARIVQHYVIAINDVAHAGLCDALIMSRTEMAIWTQGIEK